MNSKGLFSLNRPVLSLNIVLILSYLPTACLLILKIPSFNNARVNVPVLRIKRYANLLIKRPERYIPACSCGRKLVRD